MRDIIKFMDWDCKPKTGMYNNGRKALMLIDAEDFCPVASATVNIPEAACDDDEIFIKDWSENKGMVDALIAANIVEKPHCQFATGFVAAMVCKLTDEGLALWGHNE